MVKTPKTRSNKKIQGPLLAILIVCAFATVLALVVVSLVAKRSHDERLYEAGVANIKATLEDSAVGFLKPKGGIEHMPATVVNGQKIPLFGVCIDVGCPEIETQWYLLADKDQEDALQKAITDALIEKRGSGKWNVNAIVGVLGASERPYSPPTGKEWFNISIWTTAGSPEEVY